VASHIWPVPFQIARGVAKVKTRIPDNSKIRLILLVLKKQTSPDTLKTMN